jgi:hypothetical protein
MSAEEKEKVLKDWQRFIESDFSQARFTKALYNHLIQHCSFIAHYNQAGFYDTYFENPERTTRFLQQFDNDYGCKSVEYGMDYWLTGEDYRDINTSMVETFGPYKAEIYPKLRRRAKEKKLDQIQALARELEELE